MFLVLSAKRLSRCLHDDMLRHVLQSPVSFFDESPRGRILNRFSTDLEYVDVRTFLNEKQSVQNTITTLSKAAVIGTQSPMLVGVAMVITAIIAFGMSVAVKVSHSARYHESLATSRLLQHTTETVDSLSSVRAYGVTEWFWRHCCRLVDDAMRGYLCFGVTFRFVRTLTATGGFVVVMCTLLANVLFPGPNGPDPSSLGLALSSACSRAPLHKLQEFENLMKRGGRKRLFEEAPSAEKRQKQLCLNSMFSKQAVSQHTLDKLVTTFVVEGLPSFSIVEEQAFKDIEEHLAPGRKTLTRQMLTDHFDA
ncbi:hypothetical protein HPB52_023712 [Rhipicephalus sanguineus]|uniref:ABC transmembrane type-1 domain-containing protein n=1 Tax=Rhipicephalus sanguineus TaxID=34632 RepID=A0A9D4TC96_RHISA|nr:hypothetical protein HPB52_023712 [Rhipicephalus sanguineus]